MSALTTTHVNPCYSSTPVDGIVHRCIREMHFTGDHDSGLVQWSEVQHDEAAWQEYVKGPRTPRGWKPPVGATEDFIVAPPNAKTVR